MKTAAPNTGLSFSNPAVRRRLRKLAIIGCVLLAGFYLAGLAGGYLWLRYGRGIEQVRLLDVALLRIDAVRRTVGGQHFARARTEAAANNYQAAYISFASGLRQAPDDIAGRLDAAAFFRRVGAANQSLSVLEEGLVRQPDSEALIRATLEQLLESARGRYALDLLDRIYGADPRGEHAKLLLTYRIRFLLATKGAGAAAELLRKHPELKDYAPVAPVLARILWDSAERPRAISLLAGHAAGPNSSLEDFLQLAEWQQAVNLREEAVRTATVAKERFPSEHRAHALALEMSAALSPTGGPSQSDVAAYLDRFGGQPEAVAALGAIGARKGWATLVRTLYELSAVAGRDLGLLALNYADALARNSRFDDYRAVLSQIESQAGDSANPTFLLQLRLRQVIAAGALKDSDNVREYSRRLAALVRNEPDRLESFRQFFRRSGLPEAVEELAPPPPARLPGAAPAAGT